MYTFGKIIPKKFLMKKSKFTFSLTLILLILLSAGCSSTRFTATWQPDDLSEPLDPQRVFIQVHTSRLDAKQTAEKELVRMLVSLDQKPTSSLDVLGPNYRVDTSQLETLTRDLLNDDFEAAIVVSVLDVNKSQRYVPGTTYPSGFYGGYGWGHYYGYYGRVYEPGYYTTSTTIFLLTDIYDLKTRDLVWTGQTETLDPSNLNSFVREFSQVLRTKLKKDKVFASR